MQNKLSSVGTELEQDRSNGVEMRELNDTEKIYFTGPLQRPKFARLKMKVVTRKIASTQILWQFFTMKLLMKH